MPEWCAAAVMRSWSRARLRLCAAGITRCCGIVHCWGELQEPQRKSAHTRNGYALRLFAVSPRGVAVEWLKGQLGWLVFGSKERCRKDGSQALIADFDDQVLRPDAVIGSIGVA